MSKKSADTKNHFIMEGIDSVFVKTEGRKEEIQILRSTRDKLMAVKNNKKFQEIIEAWLQAIPLLVSDLLNTQGWFSVGTCKYNPDY